LLAVRQKPQLTKTATAALRQEKPLGRFVGLSVYLDRGHLAIKEVGELWATHESWGGFLSAINNLPFYRAMAFTLTFVAIVTPLTLVFGMAIALAINSLHRHLKGLMIFFSLLPFIVTPLGGITDLILDDRQSGHNWQCVDWNIW
jgi:ABC-type sulfate transport system permease subunit